MVGACFALWIDAVDPDNATSLWVTKLQFWHFCPAQFFFCHKINCMKYCTLAHCLQKWKLSKILQIFTSCSLNLIFLTLKRYQNYYTDFLALKINFDDQLLLILQATALSQVQKTNTFIHWICVKTNLRVRVN